MQAMKRTVLALTIGCALMAQAAAQQGAAPKPKILSTPEDATKTTGLVGRAAVDNMIVIFEFEAVKGMWMRMGARSKWVEHPVAKGEIFHVEVKPVDPGSRTRIAYAAVKFNQESK
jgi:hypothetical protein